MITPYSSVIPEEGNLRCVGCILIPDNYDIYIYMNSIKLGTLCLYFLFCEMHVEYIRHRRCH